MAHKVLPKKYDYSIYIDAKVFICGDIKQMFSFINKTCQFAMINHGDRNTLLEEIEACVKYKRLTNEKKEIALIQYNEYKLSGFRDNLGLVDTCILIRAHKDLDVVRAMDIWFSEFDKYPMRDQLSIMYSVWKSNVKYKIVDSSVWSNQFMIIKPHQIHTQS